MQTDKKEITGKNQKERSKIYLCGWYTYTQKNPSESTEKHKQKENLSKGS